MGLTLAYRVASDGIGLAFFGRKTAKSLTDRTHLFDLLFDP
jgi:hypothetical protein